MTCHICGRASTVDERGPLCECGSDLERYHWGLQWMLNNLTGIDHEWAREACAIARQSLNPK